MTKFHIALSGIFVTAGLMLFSCNDSKPKENVAQTGNGLVKQLWENFIKNDTAAVKNFMAEGFQAVHEDGAIDKAGELNIVSKLNIHSYTITDLAATQNGDVLVTTYKVAVEETIEGERLSKKPASRMSIFVEKEGKWLWLAHANLKSFAERVQDSAAVVKDTVQ